MAITKALADENRVRMLAVLSKGELCVCNITEIFGLAPSTISKHLSILYQAGLVDTRKDGRWIYYRLPGKEASPAIREAVRWVLHSVAENAQIAKDSQLRDKLESPQTCKAPCQN